MKKEQKGPYENCNRCGIKLGKVRKGPFGELCVRCGEPNAIIPTRTPYP